MANNNIRLDIEVRNKGLLEAIKSTNTLEKNMKTLSDAYGRGASSYQRYYRAVRKLAGDDRERTKQLLNHGKALRAEAAALSKAKKEAKEYARARREAEEANRAFDQQVRAYENLRRATDANYASTQRFKEAKRVLRAELAAGRITQQQYLDQLLQVRRAMNETAGAAGQMGRRISRNGVLMQQTGYQVGDFIVQVQSGQNVMVAFGQQATQMAGTLTMMGGKWLAIGTGLGIAIPLITAAGAAFLRARKDVDDTSESLKTLENNLNSLDKKLEDWVRTKKAASLGVTVDEITGMEGLDKAKKDLKEAQDALDELTTKAALFAQGAAGGIDISRLWGGDVASQLERAEQAVEEAAKRLADIEAKIRQEAREEAEAELLASMEEQNRERALAEYEAGQKIIAERKAWTEEAIGIFRAAQKRMRDEDVAITERTLEHLFRNRTLFYSIRFSGDQEVMSQSLTPSGRMSPSQSYEELIAMGWTPEDLERIGLTPPRKPSGGRSSKKQDPLAKLKAQLKLERDLVGVSEERARVINALGMDFVKDNPKIVEGLEAQILKTKELTELEEKRQGIIDTVESSMEDNFMAMVEGTKSVEDAFKDMARSIIKELYDVLVVQQMVGSFDKSTGTGSGIMGFLGGIFGKASGGTVQANQPYLVGEKGPEIIVPRNRGHVMNADLTSNAMGGGGDVYVTNNFTMAANGDDSVKRIIAQSMPAIVNASKQGVMDARRRGGAMKNTFG